jgi:hypothetical protein
MKNWDPTKYQGRSQEQVEANEKIIAIVLVVSIFITAVAITIKILF